MPYRNEMGIKFQGQYMVFLLVAYACWILTSDAKEVASSLINHFADGIWDNNANGLN